MLLNSHSKGVTATKELLSTNLIHLRLDLGFSVFYYAIMKFPKRLSSF
ncbi:putative 14-3-3 domain superfamily protein [Helianthus debilis subsp. tardiflorus]